jgi:hypothetical protein
MLNYLINQNFNNYTNSYIKQQKNKKNYLSTSQISKKIHSFTNNFSKNEMNSSLFKIKSPLNYKKIKLTKKIISTPLSEQPITPVDNKHFVIKMKTSTNSPIHKKNMKKFSSYKKLINKKNESIDLSLKNDKYIYYNNYINKNIIKYNNSYSNITSLTNNNIQTNFTSSVNNTAASLTNNNSNCVSQNGRKKSSEDKKSKEAKIKIKFLYKNKSLNIELNKYRNGFWLANRINDYYQLYLNESQIHKLAEDLTLQINNIINCIINLPSIKDYGAIINLTNLLDLKNKKFIGEKRYKTTMKYKNDNYFFFINNNKDIIDMTNIIVNDILNKNNYNISALKEEILKKINRSFNKTYTKNFLKTDINEK